MSTRTTHRRPNRIRVLASVLTPVVATPLVSGPPAWADNIDWIRETGAGNWSVEAFWEDRTVPGPEDIAIFPNYGQAYRCDVDIDAAVLGVLLLDPNGLVSVNGRTLTVVDDPFDVNGFLAIPAGTFELVNGTVVIDDSVNGGGAIDNDGTVVAAGVSRIDVPDFRTAGGTLRIDGRPGLNTSLTLVRPLLNAGRLELDSSGNGSSMLDAASAGVTTTSDGAVVFGGGGSQLNRYFRADLVSHGAVRLEAGARVHFDTSGRVVRLEDGTLDVEPGASLRNNGVANEFVLDGVDIVNDGVFEISAGGRLAFTGGSVTGTPLRVNGATLSLAPVSTAAGPVEVVGVTVVEGSVPEDLTLTILGVPGLNTQASFDGAENAGSVELRSTGNGYAMLLDDVFVNAVGGRLATVAGGSQPARYVRTDLVNLGTFIAGADAVTSFDAAGREIENHGTLEIEADGQLRGTAGTWLRHAGGLLRVDGTLDWTGGGFEWTGGALAGTPLQLTALDVILGPGAQGPGVFDLDGVCTFSGDVLAPQILRLLGKPGLNNDTTLLRDLALSGTLEMDSTGNGYAMVKAAPGTTAGLVVASSGRLWLGAGGSQPARYVRTDVTNDGTIEIAPNTHAYFDTGTTVLTRGAVHVGQDARLANGSSGGTFSLRSGTLDVAGAFTWTSGALELLGGTHTGNPLRIRGGTVAIVSEADPIAALEAEGTGTLFGDVPAGVDLVVTGRPGLNSTWTVGWGVRVDGRVELTTTGNGYAAIDGPSGTQPLRNRGTLVATAGAEGTTPWRYALVPIENEGHLLVEAETILAQDGETIENRGTLRVNGRLQTSPARWGLHNDAEGRLEGDGRVGPGYQLVLSDGTTAPGDGIGTLTLDHDWTQGVTGALEIELTADESDRLAVGGTARLAGALRFVPRTPAPAPGDEFTILAAAAIEGVFDDVGCGYEVRYEASQVVVRVTVAPVEGDLTCDGRVDVMDLLEVLRAWGACPGCPADFDGSGFVDVADLLVILANWS